MKLKMNIVGLVCGVLFCTSLMADNLPTVGFTYWDVGRFYDTIPSSFYDDRMFTPKGRYAWDSARYHTKVKHVAAVLDTLQMSIVALCGVESEGVVRDIVKATKCDYSYLHRTIDGRDGLDFALLYYGDMFFVDYVKTEYGRIYIEGEVASKRLGIWLTRSGYYMRSASPPHRNGDVDFTIAAGRLYPKNMKGMGLTDLMRDHERAGRGDARSAGRWYMRDRIGVDDGVLVRKSGIYIRRWLLKSDGAPLSTFTNRGYLAGYSSYLPLCLYFWYAEDDE